MSTITHWEDRVSSFRPFSDDEKQDCMQAEITELREAIKVAQEEIVNRNLSALDGDKIVYLVHELWDEVDALQAKLSAIEAQAPVEYQAFSGRWRAVDESTFNNYAEQDRRALYAAPVAPAQPSTPLTPKGMTDAVMDLVDVLARDPESTKLIDPQAWAHLSVYMPAQPVNELVEALEDARDVLYQVAHGNTACGKDAEDVGGLIATALANAKAAQPTLGLTVGDKPYTQNLIDRLLMSPQAMTERDLRSLHQSSAELIYSFSKQINTLTKAAQPLTKEQVQPSNICKKHSCLWAGDGCPHCKDEQVQPAQGELEDLLDMYWDLAYAEGHSHGKESYGTKANETRHKIRALLQSNAERVTLSFAKVNEIFDAHKDAPGHSKRYLIANAIEAEITKGQQ